MASSPPRVWQASWWVPALKQSERQDSCQRVAECSAPTPSYYVLIILSTLIASYGLLSNSTATVIGAMIVAPLMGPILGLALGTVLADARMFRRSLLAEATGVVLVILTGMAVAAVAGASHIDFNANEIAGRTRPTLFDLAIGLAAGLAGAYCTVHPGLQASVAGVAIAVALVPPLAVTGLTGTGFLTGHIDFKPVFGSFMLFFTNLLTIELASGLVFYATGFRHVKAGREKVVWRKTLAVKIVLLILTGWFLTVQLANLLHERYGLATSRNVLQDMLKDIPGADLDSLEAHLNKNKLTVRAVVGSRTEITPNTVRRLEKSLSKAMKDGLPGVEVKLVVRTVNSTYASANGYLFEPTKEGLNNDERRLQTLDVVLRELLEKYPGVDLANFTLDSSSRNAASHRHTPLNLTLSTPYVFGPRFVAELQTSLNKELAEDPLFSSYTYKLMVRSIIVKSSTSEDSVAVQAPEMRSVEEKELGEREDKLRLLITSALEINANLKVRELHLRRADVEEPPGLEQEAEASPSPSPTPDTPIDAYVARVVIQSPKLLDTEMMAQVRNTVAKLYEEETGRRLQLALDTTTNVADDLFLGLTETVEVPEGATDAEKQQTKVERIEKHLNQTLRTLVAKIPGASVNGDTDLSKLGDREDYRLYAVVTTPQQLKNQTVLKWQETLLLATPEINSLELDLENRLGRNLRLTPSRRPSPKPTPQQTPGGG